MPRFQYKAKSSAGATLTGTLDAVSMDAAANQLLQTDAIPLSISPVEEKPDAFGELKERLGLGKPGLDDLILFSRQCYTLNKSGVPIIRGFRLLADSYRNPMFAQTIDAVADDLETGRELSSALSRHPKVFSPLYVNMIRVGETSGRLDEAFLHLHEYYERDRRTRNQLKAAFRYPAFVLTAIVVAVIILMTFVIPKFASFYQANGLDLPLPTRIIMGVSNVFVDFWPLLLGAVVIGIFGFRRHINTEKGRLWWDGQKLRFWIVGDIALRGTLARFSRTLAMALAAGVPVLQAVNITARALGNDYLSGKVINMRESIERGESMLRAASRQQVFTPIVLQMIAVGEESGRIDEMLAEVAGFYEREVDYDVENLNAAIEPILTVALAGLVLLLMLGIFLPMWNLTDLVG